MVLTLIILLVLTNAAWWLAWLYRGGTIRGLQREIMKTDAFIGEVTKWNRRSDEAARRCAEELAAVRRNLGDAAVDLMTREAA